MQVVDATTFQLNSENNFVVSREHLATHCPWWSNVPWTVFDKMEVESTIRVIGDAKEPVVSAMRFTIRGLSTHGAHISLRESK